MHSNILITGSRGQLGTMLSQLLPDAVAVDMDELDITEATAVNAFVKLHGINTIVNCAAYTAVDRAEDEPELAYKVNAYGAEVLAKTGCRIVHISTDYVFDGTSNRPYTPDDLPNPVSVYGKSKLAGEKAVLEYADVAAIIRTSWMYSPYGNNFVKTMLRLGAEKTSINVVCDQVGSPTYAGDLANAIVSILPRLTKNTRGIYHFANEGVCSWYDLSVEVMQSASLDCVVVPVLGAAYPTRAIRPFYSVLDKAKVRCGFGLSIPHWRNSLMRCIHEIQKISKI
ncbi:MAG: dTDP-4-dehydrorhamnose reductase [Alphaproteobacteria bacterium]|nr:dTDP-4-dehydrorhamnose reductase [Alphaproteobacteria bacterium]